MENDTIMKELEELPNQLKETENKLLAHLFKKSELKKLMDHWEYVEMAKISEEKTEGRKHETVKNKYPNDIARRAELELRKNVSKAYNQINTDYSERDKLEKKEQIEFNYKTNRFRAVRKMVDFIARR